MGKQAELRIVFNEDGSYFYDIYIEGSWIGSRRTVAQCYEQMHGMGVTVVKVPNASREHRA